MEVDFREEAKETSIKKMLRREYWLWFSRIALSYTLIMIGSLVFVSAPASLIVVHATAIFAGGILAINECIYFLKPSFFVRSAIEKGIKELQDRAAFLEGFTERRPELKKGIEHPLDYLKKKIKSIQAEISLK